MRGREREKKINYGRKEKRGIKLEWRNNADNNGRSKKKKHDQNILERRATKHN